MTTRRGPLVPARDLPGFDPTVERWKILKRLAACDDLHTSIVELARRVHTADLEVLDRTARMNLPPIYQERDALAPKRVLFR